MSAYAIREEELVREFTRELRNSNAAIFAGAGLSMASGYLNWAGLLEEIIRDLRLDPEKEHDLVTIAQYHCNQAGGNKSRLSQTILNAFSPQKSPMENHRILARLPIHTYWTTNYDKLIEQSLVDEKKVPDVKYTMKQLSVTRPNRDVVVYKMHGDIDNPSEAVICKDDYESYPFRMGAFVSALRGDLIEKTFLFLGFSFTDPNIDYILSRVRVLYEGHQRHHYCILKQVAQLPRETLPDFEYRKLKQEYFINDLKRFGLYTVLVNDYAEITLLLEKIHSSYKRSTVFVSGAADNYGSIAPASAEQFLFGLGNRILLNGNRVVTGFGLGVGSAVINGVLAYLDSAGRTLSDNDIIMRPFPQVASPGSSLLDQWTAYRSSMISHAGIAVFVFGNKKDATGKVITSNGMRQEFELCVKAGVAPIPVGATGFMAAELWKEVTTNFTKYYPRGSNTLKAHLHSLGDSSRTGHQHLDDISAIITELQKG